jgi:hypothetical protein
VTKYQINKDLAGSDAYKRTVEADWYDLKDGYFHFFEGYNTSAKAVFTIASSRVNIIEADKA